MRSAPRSTAGAHDYDRIVNYECNNGNGAVFNHIPTHAEAQAGGCAPGTWLVMSVSSRSAGTV